ncbi:MAG: SEC-C metal-binding domain-containing protein, partial [Acidobacteriota bacterium]
MAARVSRNDPCPCGSGLKYKKCHEGKDAEKPGRTGMLTMVLLGLLVVGGATAVVISFARGAGSAARTGGRPGQVWSPEHGHWHDAAVPGRAPINPIPIGEQKPAPAGTPPPGKV